MKRPIKIPWLEHPRSKKPDAMLTFSVLAFIVCLFKFLLSGFELTIGEFIINLGDVDSGAIAALLTPVLGAYVGRKITDPPLGTEKKDTNEEEVEIKEFDE